MKRTLALVLSVVMLLTMSLSLVACGNKNNPDDNKDESKDEKVVYTVTVVDDEGNAIKGVKVTFIPKGATEMPFSTDAEGKASHKTDKELTVKITSVPSGYEYSDLNKALSFDKDGNLKVTLKKLAPFVIKVVDEQGNAVSGVKVQMCDEAGSCRMPRTTDANGEATYPYEEGSFHAQLTVVPDGYSVEDPAKYYDFENGVATISL